jgi:hypothetical protein
LQHDDVVSGDKNLEIGDTDDEDPKAEDTDYQIEKKIEDGQDYDSEYDDHLVLNLEEFKSVEFP